MADDTAIKVSTVTKAFKLPHERTSSVKSAFINFHKRKKGYETQQVLNNISFEVKKGDFFGIVGRNGSGKSTLLKLLAGIYTSDKGDIQINGKLTPFIELGVGFNPELSGRENVFLNGALLGFNRKEMEAMYDEIVEFAELERFMDQKLKNYSSGMQVRLAFSIAIRANTDILVLDEVLAVGDEAFQRKCSEYFSKVKESRKTVVLVTHDMSAVRKYCNKAMLLHNGDITVFGSPEDVANQYTLENYKVNEKVGDKGKFPVGLSKLVPNIEVKPLSPKVLSSSDIFTFEIRYEVTEDIPVRFGISVIDEKSDGATSIFDDQPKDEHGNRITTSDRKGKYTFKYQIPLNRFNNRDFLITATLYKVHDKSSEQIAFTSSTRACSFAIRGEEHDGGLLKQKGEWVK